MKSIKCYNKIVGLLVILLVFVNCKDSNSNTNTQTATKQTLNSQGDHSHEHNGTDHSHEEEEEEFILDEEPIYKVGDIFKEAQGVNEMKETITYPADAPVNKLIAFIDYVPDDVRVFRNNDDHINAIKSLDSFAIQNKNYKVSVIHFSSEKSKDSIFLNEVTSNYLEHLVIHDDDYYEKLEVNMGPMYFLLDTNNRVENIFTGNHYSYEFIK